MRFNEEFRKKIRKIADLAFANAVSQPDVHTFFKGNPREWNETTMLEFLYLVHDGFKKAQDLLIRELLLLQEIRKGVKEVLKESRKERDKESEELFKVAFETLNDQEDILLHIGDGIAWQLLGGQVSNMRRFYTGETKKDLSSSNIKHAKSVADGINASREKFALISDATHSIQIGDLLIKDRHVVGVMELKEGNVNDKLGAIKTDLYDTEVDLEEIKKGLAKLSLSEFKQLDRMLKQDQKMFKTIEVINSDKGTDLRSGKEMQILTPKHFTVNYFGEIKSAIQQARKDGYATSEVDGIIRVGVYMSSCGKKLPDCIASMFEKKKFKILGGLERISRNVSQPLFAKPFSPDTMIDILLGDVNVLIEIDLEAFFAMLKSNHNIETRVLSRKETMKLKEGIPKSKQNFFEMENQAFEFTLSNLQGQGRSVLLGGGMISKMLYDNIAPDTIALDLKGALELIAQSDTDEGKE